MKLKTEKENISKLSPLVYQNMLKYVDLSHPSNNGETKR